MPGFHSARLSGAALVVGLIVAACGATATPAPVTPAPATPAAATPAAAASATPAATRTPEPSPARIDFTSAAYGYSTTYPGSWLTSQATQPWDGTSPIGSTGPYTDQVVVPGSILFFVYGAPTDLALDAYAAATQAQVAEWHECPADPGAGPGSEPATYAAANLALDGTPGRLHQMICLGVFVQKLMVVRDGKGLVVNMLAPPGSQSKAEQLFRDLVAEISWPA
jgi:hypothetical protein